MWEISGRRAELVVALGYYLRGSRCSKGVDLGYNAVNAAFLLDILAAHDERTALRATVRDDSAAPRRQQAADLRRGVVEQHRSAAEAALRSPRIEDWWLLATVAEAVFGLGDHQGARTLLRAARLLPDLPDWQLESTARQLTRLSQLQSTPDGAGAAVVAELVGCEVQQIETMAGRVGLALSGGGFRASFFLSLIHI